MPELNGETIDLETLWAAAQKRLEFSLGMAARERMARSREVVVQIVEAGATVYGVNTGFGKLSDVHIPSDELETLQLNLVRSHACGIGKPLSVAETRAMMLLRANVLALGYSGARPELAETLLKMLQQDVTPMVPEAGSVGASGDLAPLAHLALAMIGEGPAWLGNEPKPAAQALADARIPPVSLQAKEGLALLNGTQAMGAVGGLAIWRGIRLLHLATGSGAMALEALKGTPAAFDARIHAARPHAGQARVARHLRELLDQSEIRESHREGDPRVQDAYSLRCIPQVHGAVLDVLEHARNVLETESASATDNPLVFSEAGDVISGGNFHGAPLAYGLDYAAIALCDLGNIVERRIDRLVNPDLNEGLPAFLAPHPGSSSGFMIAHVAAVALLAEAKVLAHPASIDNAPTSGGKEDHVSMGMTSALKLRRIVEILESMIAIELMAAAQGLEYRAPLRPGVGVQGLYAQVRRFVSPLDQDRPLSEDIARLAKAISAGDLAP